MNDHQIERAAMIPDAAVESIRKLYPFPRNKQSEMAAVRRALERLVQGERDGSAMSKGDAIIYLRGRIEAAAASFYGREKKFTPHLTTFLNQSRYLKGEELIAPENLADAIVVLKCYPGIKFSDANYQVHLPVLKVIDQIIKQYGEGSVEYLRERVTLFAECVAEWDAADLQYLPGPIKFFKEERYAQDDRHWRRNPPKGYGAEREQIQRIVGAMGRDKVPGIA